MKKDTAVIDRRYSNMDAKNKLYFGDNLKILREYVPDPAGRDGPDPAERDPPFNSSATYPSADGCSGKERRRVRHDWAATRPRRLPVARPGAHLTTVPLPRLLWYTSDDEHRKTTSKTSTSQGAFAGRHRKAGWAPAVLCLPS